MRDRKGVLGTLGTQLKALRMLTPLLGGRLACRGASLPPGNGASDYRVHEGFETLVLY